MKRADASLGMFLAIMVILLAVATKAMAAQTDPPPSSPRGPAQDESLAKADAPPGPIAKSADPQAALGYVLPYWSVVPFIVILLAIALIPLVKGHWWEGNLNKGVVSFLCALPVFAYLLWLGPLGQEVLVEVLREYYAFIILLLALFTISGGIYLEGDLRATPLVNTTFLAAGAILASFIGTTGSAMLLIRPLIKTNRQRRNKIHIFVFFIFLVANIGGSLLPVGDPPLFLGYLYGVPFFWTLFHLWPMWMTTVAILLALFYVWDTWAYSREKGVDLARDAAERKQLRVHGKMNLVLLLGVLLAVVFLRAYELSGGAQLDLAWMQQPVMMLLALISFAMDHSQIERSRKDSNPAHLTPRDHNGFTFGPIIEVAVLFIAIFITMTPAICLLKAQGSKTGITEAWQFFWLSGGLSSFLDNAPTYATYFALGQGVTKALLASQPNLAVVATNTEPIGLQILIAISVGAVFMGANTYIGNAPNFMVKTICENARIKMPSFFGYMLYSILILIPTFLLIMYMYLL